MSKIFFTLSLLAFLSLGDQFLGELREAQQTYESDTYRNDILRRAQKTINEHNSRPHRTFQMGLTKFASYTQKQFLTEFAGGCVQMWGASPKQIKFDSLMGPKKEVDWRQSGIATNVKDQGKSPSGAVFAAVGAIEGAMNIKNRGVSFQLSEQQAIDCTYELGLCPEGTVEHTLKYAKTNPLQKEEDYHYEGQRKSCRADYVQGIVELTDLFVVESSQQQLMEAVSRQPVPFCFDAQDLQYYVSGVISLGCCSCQEVNYCALLIGYNKNEWIAKASFGEDWGEAGYFRIKRGFNTCGMLNHLYFPVV